MNEPRSGIIFRPAKRSGMGEIVVSLGKIGLYGERLLVALDCFLVVLPARDGDGQMMVSVGRSSIDLDRPAGTTSRVAKSPLLQSYEAQPIERVEIVVIGIKNNLIALLGLPKWPLIVE
jgi:hypothetical protein